MKEAIKVVYFNVALFCVLLVGLEAGGQLLFYLAKGYPVWQADQHLISQSSEQLFELHPWLVARLRGGVKIQQGPKTVSSTPAHTRSTGADSAAPDAIRIAVVGGSTTFGSGLSDEDTWPTRLQALLGPGYRVTNYGMPGYSTAEGIIQMGLVVPESRPDIVIFFEGWNDLRNSHLAGLGPDYYGHGLRQYANLDVERPKPTGFLGKLAEVSAIGHLAFVLAKSGPAPKAKPVARGTLHTDPDSLVDRVYRRNLGTLKTLAQAMGAQVFFVPQLVDATRLTSDSTAHEWTPTLVDSAMPGLMARMNRIMAGVCAPGESRCRVLQDIAEHRWAHDDFMDEGHFVRKGSDTFAALLATHIRSVESSVRQARGTTR